MELRNNSKYIAKPANVFTTILIILTALLMLQIIITETVATFFREPLQQAVEPAEEQTEEEKRLARIQYSAKKCLPDGTIHLVHHPERKHSSQGQEWDKQQIYDVNDNLLWEGIGRNSPYKYLSWTAEITHGESFQARDMKWMHVVSPDVCRTLDIPVKSNNKTTQIWRYIPWRQSFIGYKPGGGTVGYVGATGFADSSSQARPFGKFARFIAWCPKGTTTPKLLWQTSKSIYEINFEKRKVELIFESPDANIDHLLVHTWDTFRPRNRKPGPDYKPLLHCKTKDGKNHLIIRGETQPLTVKIPKGWNERGNSQIRFTAFEQSVFLHRQWLDPPWLPKVAGSPWNSGESWREYRAKPKKHRFEMYKVDDRGNIELLSQFVWTMPGEKPGPLAATRWFVVREKAQRCVSQFSPALFDFFFYLHGKYIWSLDSYLNRGEFAKETLYALDLHRPRFGVWSWILVALMVGFAYRHARPRCTSRPAMVFWLVFVALFGVAGLLTYLALNHTPVIKCPSCGKTRGLNHPKCPRCQTELPAPKPGRLDLIFDTQLKTTT